MELNAGSDPDARKIAGMYKEYQSILRGNNALDFDDLIVKTVELFQHNPDILDYYQERFRYIMAVSYTHLGKNDKKSFPGDFFIYCGKVCLIRREIWIREKNISGQ